MEPLVANADAVAARAMSQIGTPFRLRGRTAGVALDCVGLVAHALDVAEPPNFYSLKGTKIGFIKSCMDNLGLCRIDTSIPIQTGDIAVVECTEGQFHLMIAAADGWVHSHAGLQKVVHTPGQNPWPIIAYWRVKGK